MASDRLEIGLKSTDKNRDWNDVDLRITAYITGDEHFNDNTLVFHGDPPGSNCERTYLQVEFPDQETIAEIHQFLSHHLQQDDGIERSRRVPVVDGERINTWATGRRGGTENMDYLTVSANSERISFGPLATMTPDIRFYETATEEGPQDQRNGERLLDFFEEISNNTIEPANVPLQDDELSERCLPLFNEKKYAEAARLAGQILEERVSEFAPEAKSDLEGAKLMREVFSPDGGSLQIASDGGEQTGLMSMFAGSYQAIRNPLSHRTPDPNRERYLDDLDRIQTKNILHNIDYLLTTLERNLD